MIQGFDISFWQDNNYTPVKVDFQKMAQHGKFVIIRQGQGLYTDEDFQDYWRDSKPSGLVRMAYHFFTWDVSPEAQAEKFYNDLKNDPPARISFDGKVLSGYWGDFEWWSTVPSNALQLYGRFADRMKQLTGLYPGIYTARGFWQQYGKDQDVWAEMPLWSAEWNTSISQPTVFGPWARLGKRVAIWQNGTPAIGNDIGVESKEVDSNLFMGTLEDLTGESTMPSVYENYAKAIYIDEKSTGVTADLLKTFDVVISKGTIGETKVNKFLSDAQLSKEAEKPVIMFCESWTDLYTDWATFPTDNKIDPQLIRIREMLLAAKDSGLPVHGIMLDMSLTTWRDNTDKVLTDVLITKVGDYLVEIINKYTKLPVFVYMNNTPYHYWPNSPHISGLLDRHSLSFYGARNLKNEPIVLVNGVPATEMRPGDFVKYYPTSDWQFWLYRWISDTQSINGIWRGTKGAMYSKLNYVPANPGDPGDLPPPPPDDLTAMVTALVKAVGILTQRVEKLENGIWKYQI